MHSISLPTRNQRLVDQTVAVPTVFIGVDFGQRDSLADKAAQGIGLRQRLTIQLVYPCCRAVGRHHYQAAVLVVGLGNGRQQVEQGRARRDAHHHRLIRALRHAQGIEARRALVGDGIAGDVGTLVQVMYDGSIAATWTDHRMTDSVLDKQGREDINIDFITIHDNIFFTTNYANYTN